MAQVGMKAFRPPRNPLQVESKAMFGDPKYKLEPTAALFNQQMVQYYQAQQDAIAFKKGKEIDEAVAIADLNAIATKKVQHLFYNADEDARQAFVNDFNCWVLGKSQYNQPEYANVTPWGEVKLCGRDIDNYITKFPAAKQKYELMLALLRKDIPTDIRTAWMYYKYIVRSPDWNEVTFLADWAWWTEPGWKDGTYIVDNQNSEHNSKVKAPTAAPSSIQKARTGEDNAGDPGAECVEDPCFPQSPVPKNPKQEEENLKDAKTEIKKENANPEATVEKNTAVDSSGNGKEEAQPTSVKFEGEEDFNQKQKDVLAKIRRLKADKKVDQEFQEELEKEIQLYGGIEKGITSKGMDFLNFEDSIDSFYSIYLTEQTQNK